MVSGALVQALQGCHVFEKLVAGIEIVHLLLLGHEAQLGPVVVTQLPDGLAVQPNLAGGGFQNPGEDIHQGGFARAVGAEEAVNARGEGIREFPQGFGFAVGFGEVGEFQSGIGHGGTSLLEDFVIEGHFAGFYVLGVTQLLIKNCPGGRPLSGRCRPPEAPRWEAP